MNRAPNFLIAGVAKAGTTSLFHYLRQHPDLYMSPIKEPGFFAAADLDSGQYHVRPRVLRDREAVHAYVRRSSSPGDDPLVLDWEAYQELFSIVDGQRAIGEASVGYYFHLPGVPRAIHTRLPDVRIIFVLRDIAERLHAAYIGDRWRWPGLSFRSWYELARKGGEDAREIRGAIRTGHYAEHIGRFLATFSRGQLRFYLYEDYRREPSAMVRDIFAFLDLDPSVPIDMSRRYNEAVVPRIPMLHAFGERLRGRGVTRWVPSPVRRLASRFSYTDVTRERMSPGDRGMVIEHYRDDIQRTSAFIDRDLSAWLRV